MNEENGKEFDLGCRNDVEVQGMQRSKVVDICKGIGIISIVIGHTSWSVQIGEINLEMGPFVYLYHLAIFFFCSGYLYKEVDLGNFLIKKVKTLYIPFVLYSFLYIVLRPFFIWWGVVDAPNYTLQEYVIAFTDVITFNGGRELLSAFWFLPMMFATMCIYACIVYFTQKLPVSICQLARVIICTLVGVVGLCAADNNLGLLHNLQISYLMVFVVELGYLYKRMEPVLSKFINPVTLLCAFIIMILVLKSGDGIIELSKNMIISKKMFYPVTIVGIIFCLSLSKIIEKVDVLEYLISYAGKNSLHIMALHFFAIKVLDWICCCILRDFSVLGSFPYSFPKLWPLYYVWGVGFPLIVVYVCKKLRRKWEKTKTQ